MFKPVVWGIASFWVCLAVQAAGADVIHQQDAPGLVGTFVHGQSPVSATVDFGFDFALMPDIILEVGGTGTPGTGLVGSFPADLVVSVTFPDGTPVIPPTVIGPYGETFVIRTVDNTPGDLFGDLDGGLVGVTPAVFQVVIQSNDTYTDVVTPSAVDITSVTLNLIECNQSCFGDDGFVGIADLNIVLGNWNMIVIPGDCLAGDHSGDGFVGIEDLNAVLGNWNAGTPPAVAIPEPATLLPLAGVMAVLTGQSSRRLPDHEPPMRVNTPI